jgi:hypothetical protein
MATSTTTGFSIPASASIANHVSVPRVRRRRISPRAGHALEILGHAIEYLTDELVQENPSFLANNAQLEAVQLLMALNRQVYFECPELPGLSERFRSLLHLHAA